MRSHLKGNCVSGDRVNADETKLQEKNALKSCVRLIRSAGPVTLRALHSSAGIWSQRSRQNRLIINLTFLFKEFEKKYKEIIEGEK